MKGDRLRGRSRFRGLPSASPLCLSLLPPSRITVARTRVGIVGVIGTVRTASAVVWMRSRDEIGQGLEDILCESCLRFYDVLDEVEALLLRGIRSCFTTVHVFAREGGGSLYAVVFVSSGFESGVEPLSTVVRDEVFLVLDAGVPVVRVVRLVCVRVLHSFRLVSSFLRLFSSSVAILGGEFAAFLKLANCLFKAFRRQEGVGTRVQ